MVKNFLKSGNVQGQVVKRLYGNIERPFELVTRKVVEATNEELKLILGSKC
ncbi:MAG: hypothetical protein R2784_05225 [Saprospiraceae bacterium]